MHTVIRSSSIFCLFLLLSVIAPRIGHSQEADTTHWNDEEIYTEQASETNYFAVGGGVIGGVFMPNLDGFNKNFAQPFVGRDVDNKVFMLGGQGFIALPWIKNVRVGGMAIGGESKQCCIDTEIYFRKVRRTLEYHVGYGGLSLDYVLPLHVKHFNIVPGIVLGLGGVQVYAEQAQSRDSAGEFNIRNEFDQATINSTHTYHSKFFLYMPQLQFEYNPLGFMMIRAAVGYQGTSMGTWVADREVGIGGTTAFANVNGSGLIASLGVFFGLFP